MSVFKGRFGGGDQDSGAAGTPPDESPYAPGVQAAVQAYWDAIGRSDTDRISYLVNPMFLGAPAWPGVRQTYRVVRTPHTLILSSDGLADPDPQVVPPAPGVGWPSRYATTAWCRWSCPCPRLRHRCSPPRACWAAWSG